MIGRVGRIGSVGRFSLRNGVAAFTPAALFAAAEPGVWYDPSDLTTLFQDTAGTTPVTAAGQSVALVLDKSNGLTLGSELITNGDFSNGTTGWGVQAGATLAAVSGELEVTGNGGSFPAASQTFNVVAGRTYVITATARKGTASTASIYISPASGTDIITNSSTTVTLRRLYVAASSSITLVAGLYGASATGTAYFDNISVKELAGNHATQSTAASRPTYQIDSNGKPFLSFDGVDDFLITPTITPGAGKAQVFAGVQKLSDAAAGIAMESSVNSETTNGSIGLAAPGTATKFVLISRGTAVGITSTTDTAYNAPITSVLTGLGDISGDRATLRVNGTQVAQATTNQGTGNYLAYPIYIGRRGGSSLPFNGRIYSLIVRFGANLTAQNITDTETWVNSKTGAY